MAISALAAGQTDLSAKSNPRTGGIKKITPHHMAGVMTAKACAEYHKNSDRQASANYYIGNDGTIWAGVDESRRAWTSASYDNDVQAITIEVSNSASGEPWPISDAAYEALVNLCIDLCKRYGITLTWTGTISGTLTCHDMFANTNCPGATLKSKFPNLVSRVNAAVSGKTTTTTTTTTSTAKKWTQDCVLTVGDTVKSISCSIKGLTADKTGVYVPALGEGAVPIEDVTEASDTADGKYDDYLATTKAKVFLAECKVTKIVSNSIVQIKGAKSGKTYNVYAEPLMAKR